MVKSINRQITVSKVAATVLFLALLIYGLAQVDREAAASAISREYCIKNSKGFTDMNNYNLENIVRTKLESKKKMLIRWQIGTNIRVRPLFSRGHDADNSILSRIFREKANCVSALTGLKMEVLKNLPLGQGAFRILAKNKHLTDVETDEDRKNEIKSISKLKYRGFPTIIYSEAHGWTDCVYMLAYNPKNHRIVAGAISILTRTARAGLYKSNQIKSFNDTSADNYYQFHRWDVLYDEKDLLHCVGNGLLFTLGLADCIIDALDICGDQLLYFLYIESFSRERP